MLSFILLKYDAFFIENENKEHHYFIIENDMNIFMFISLSNRELYYQRFDVQMLQKTCFLSQIIFCLEVDVPRIP